ncbi:MAG: ATP-dependent Clp protease proteolytic subunit [Acidimicrobiia bacterium]
MTYIPNPEIWETTNRGERSSSLFGRLLRENIIFLGFPITDDVANVVCAQLIHLESENPEKDINIYINSPGGDINAMFAIYDTMSYIRPDINTICLGQAASAAAVLLAGGTPGKRLALPHSRVIIHQPYSGAQGQASDVELAAKEIMRLKSALEEVLSKHTGKTVDQIRKDTDRDFVMTATEAKDYGIIDAILEPRTRVDLSGPIRAS